MSTYLAHHGRPVEFVADYVTGKRYPRYPRMSGYVEIVEHTPMGRPAEGTTKLRRDLVTVETLTWEPYWSLGMASTVYFHAELAGMTLEIFHRGDVWEWSFYDPTSPEPDLAVARDDAPTREEAESDLLDYAISHYLNREASHDDRQDHP